MRLASSTKGALRYTAGLYVLDENSDTNRSGRGGPDMAITLVRFPPAPFFPQVPAPLGTGFGLAPGQIGRNWGTVKTRAYALFGSLDYDLTPPSPSTSARAKPTKPRISSTTWTPLTPVHFWLSVTSGIFGTAGPIKNSRRPSD